MRQRSVQIPSLQGTTYNGKPAPGWASWILFKCSTCKRLRQSISGFTTGYGRVGKRKICFDCCGKADRKRLEKDKSIVLYLAKRPDGYHVINWPGTLDIRVYGVRQGRHNIAGTRLDVWFTVAGRQWHGVNIGDNDILRCKVSKGH